MAIFGPKPKSRFFGPKSILFYSEYQKTIFSFWVSQNRSGKCVWRYSRKEKSIFTVWKQDDKKVKNRDFSKGLVHNFGQKFEVSLFLF